MALDQPSADQSRKNCDLQFFFVIGDGNQLPRSQVFLSVSMCVSCVVFLCVSVCLLSMCEATVCLLSP